MSWRVPGAAWASVPHGFTGRAGGVSAAPYQSLNLSFAVGDRSEDVRRNWQIVQATAPPGVAFARMRQVHGCTVRVASARQLDLGDADAAISASPGVAVGVLTADCVPILLSAAGGRVVAAIHAGWRGTAANIAAATVQAMASGFGVAPGAIHAMIGPAIGACCYEVGSEVVAALIRAAGSRGVMTSDGQSGTSRGRAHVDLRAVNARQLVAAGLPDDQVGSIGPCTRCAADVLFSHRGAAGGPTGRQLSWIAAVPAEAP